MFIDAIESVGGPAEVASPEQVAAYLESLFPLDRDPKRQALQRARSADPSDSGSQPRPPVDLARMAATAEARMPVACPRAASGARHPARHTVGQGPDGGDRAPGASLPGSRRRKPSPGHGAQLRTVLVLGAVLLAAGGGGAFLLLRPSGPPAERIATAAATPAREARESALKGLGQDARASAPELSRAGALLLEAGAHDAALELAEAFVQRFPKDVEAHLLAARAAIELRMGKRAERAIDEAAALVPADVRPLLARAELRERQGDMPGALAALAKAYEKRPRDAQIAPRYGKLLSHSGKLDEASEVLGAWTRDHGDAESLAELAFVRYRQTGWTTRRPCSSARCARLPSSPWPTTTWAPSSSVRETPRPPSGPTARRTSLPREDPRALVARCQLHARQGQDGLVSQVKRELSTRFPDRADALTAQCTATD